MGSPKRPTPISSEPLGSATHIAYVPLISRYADRSLHLHLTIAHRFAVFATEAPHEENNNSLNASVISPLHRVTPITATPFCCRGSGNNTASRRQSSFITVLFHRPHATARIGDCQAATILSLHEIIKMAIYCASGALMKKLVDLDFTTSGMHKHEHEWLAERDQNNGRRNAL
jgi:hypothetical protein